MADDKPGFFAELKRRNVLRAAVLYVGAVWAISQGISQLTPALGLPEVATRWFLIACVIGFPFWVTLAWFFEFTPHGVKRESEVAPDAPVRHSNARRLDFAIIGVLVVAIGLLVWRLTAVQHARASPRVAAATVKPGPTTVAPPVLQPITALPVPAKSVAVLPFENLSADKNNAYFADGIQDLILTKLADIGDLKVIARTSTEQYQSHPTDLETVGRQLNVATFLEGSVQRAGNEVLINVQLIDAKTDSHIWAQSYQRTLTNIFGVEGEVADKVAKALNAKLTQTEAARVAAVPTTNAAAYDAYLRGEYHMTEFSRGEQKPDLTAAVREYSEAVRQDPKFALAWARLANAQTFLGAEIYDDPKTAAKLFDGGKASIAEALALQPGLAAAWVSKGIADIWPSGSRHAALGAFRKAHALQPQDAGALWWVAYTLSALGKTRDEVHVLQQLRVVDPKRALPMLGVAQATLHHFADAEGTLQRALAMSPGSWVTLDSLAGLYAYLGDLPRMGNLIENAPASVKANPNFTDTVGEYLFYRRDWSAARKLWARAKEPQDLYAAFYPVEIKRGDVEWYAGNQAAAREQYQLAIPLLAARLKQHPKSPRWHFELGWVYARLGRDAQALQQGELALGTRNVTAGVVRHSPGGALGFARIVAQIDKAGDAIAILDTLLAEPTGWYVSVPLVKMDPAWDPIRRTPQFQALLKKYAKDKPAVIPSAPAVSASSAKAPTP